MSEQDETNRLILESLRNLQAQINLLQLQVKAVASPSDPRVQRAIFDAIQKHSLRANG